MPGQALRVHPADMIIQFVFFNLFLCIYLFLAVLSSSLCRLCRALQAFSGRGGLGVGVGAILLLGCLLLMWRLLSLQSMDSRGCGLSGSGAGASLLQGMWNLFGLGITAASPALAARFLTTEPPGKPPGDVLFSLTSGHSGNFSHLRGPFPAYIFKYTRKKINNP